MSRTASRQQIIQEGVALDPHTEPEQEKEEKASNRLHDALESWGEMMELTRDVAIYVIESRIDMTKRRKRSIDETLTYEKRMRRLSSSPLPSRMDAQSSSSAGKKLGGASTSAPSSTENATAAPDKDCEDIKKLAILYIRLRKAQHMFQQELAKVILAEDDVSSHASHDESEGEAAERSRHEVSAE